MLQQIENDIKNIIVDLYHIDYNTLNNLVLELPPEKYQNNFDVSTNIALILSRAVKKPPLDIANEIVTELNRIDYIEKCEVVVPAFINILLQDGILLNMIDDIAQNGDVNLVKQLGRRQDGNAERVNIEFWHNFR